MLPLQHPTYSPAHLCFSTPFSRKINQTASSSVSGIGWDSCEGYLKRIRRRRRRKSRTSFIFKVGAVERDSEFEFDPVKAREALRKLDEQLQSLAEKKIDPPKIRASDLNQARGQMTEKSVEISETFLAYAASALLIFTIVYNVLFLTVIKPSIDGPEPTETTSSMMEAE